MHKIRQPEKNWVACACCLNFFGERRKATTIVNGYAVCDEHITLVSQPGFELRPMEKRKRSAV
jgi:hypothetical protein